MFNWNEMLNGTTSITEMTELLQGYPEGTPAFYTDELGQLMVAELRNGVLCVSGAWSCEDPLHDGDICVIKEPDGNMLHVYSDVPEPF